MKTNICSSLDMEWHLSAHELARLFLKVDLFIGDVEANKKFLRHYDSALRVNYGTLFLLFSLLLAMR